MSKRLLGVFCIALLLSGCGHNIYLEREITGIRFDIPMGEGTLGFAIGCDKTVRATVRGGASFETSSSNGGGLFSGAGGQSKITQFKSNAQLNEGNLKDVLVSTNCPAEVKVELAKNLVEAAHAPYFPGSILQTKESTIHIGRAAIQSNNVEQIQSKDPQGLDKLVDATASVIGTNVVSTAIATTGGVVHDVVNPLQGTVAEVKETVEKVDAVVNDATKVTKGIERDLIVLIAVIVIVILGIIIIVTFISARKGKNKKPEHKHIHVADTSEDAQFDVQSPVAATVQGETIMIDDAQVVDTTDKEKEPQPKVPFSVKFKSFCKSTYNFIKLVISWILLIPPPVRKKIAEFLGRVVKDKYEEYKSEKAKKKAEEAKKKK